MIDFIRPLWLILIPVAIIFLFTTSKALNRKGRIRKNIMLVMRSVIFTLLLLSIAGMGIVWTIDDNATVFLVDSSDSMKDYNPVSENFVKEALKHMTDKDSAGIILFGDEPVMENFLSQKPSFEKINSAIGGKYTNIEKAITAGMSILPDKSRKRIVLITDGEENEGDSSKAAGILKEKGIDLKVFKIERDRGKEVAAASVTAPQSLNKGEEFNIVVNLKSNINTTGKLTLFDGNEKAAEEKVEISKGENRFVFKDKADTTGFKTYRAVIDADEDMDSRNNEASTFMNILDEPMILLIEGKPGEGEEISKMLDAAKAHYKMIEAQSAPSSLQALVQYKTIILSNVSAENLSNGFLEALEPYVKDFGGGLIASGGEDSFALGGYYKTSLEKVLPVNMELKGKKAIPDMSIILVIDKSSSMSQSSGGITKLDLAKEAAARVLDSLRDGDEIGVLAFDTAMYWVVEPQKIANRDEIRNDIGTIRQGGGTSILPPLEEAVKTMKGLDSKIKHVILLTDGQAERTGYDKVLDDAANSGITVSTVAAGQDADINLLQYISQKAGGRFYQTNEYTNLPTIFAKETFMAAKSYLNNREFVPKITSLHPVIGNAVEKGLPKLLGYVAASPKDAARVVLESDDEDPILTLWQYGLGKTAAWNSDMTGRWSANYISWENNLTLWNSLINWTIENYEGQELEINTFIEGGYGQIKAKQTDNNEEFATKAVITTPSLKTIEIDLAAEAPGQYKGSFRLDEIGTYMIKTVQSKDGEIKRAVGTGLSVPYSPEYAIEAKTEKLDRLVNEAGGKFIKDPKEVYEGPIADVTGRRDLTSVLLLFALLLFLADIAIRRLNLPLEKLSRLFSKVSKIIKIERKGSKAEVSEKSADIEKKADSLIEKQSQVEKGEKEIKAEVKKETKKEISETLDTSALLKRKKKR